MIKTTTLLLSFLCAVFAINAQPYFEWGKTLGGMDYETGQSIAVDAKGNVYTTGLFMGTADFDPGPNTYNLSAVGNIDAFISKIDASGKFVWAMQVGGLDNEIGNSITTDAQGNVYITGYFSGTADFDPGVNTFYMSSTGSNDIYICKLDASGNFQWAIQMGGALSDAGYSIKLDSKGNIYTTGLFAGFADFDPGAGLNNLSCPGTYGTFISKLDSSGNFIWAKNFDGSTDNYGFALAVDSKDNVYTTGFFNGVPDFDPSSSSYLLASLGDDDAYIAKFDSSGNFVWARNMGGTNADRAFGITLDASDNVYTTGAFYGTCDFDPGTGIYNLSSAGNEDIFVSKLNSSGNFVWARNMGGSIDDIGFSIAVDGSGSVYTTGYFNNIADFDPGSNVNNLSGPGSRNIFISKLNNSGNFVWAKHLNSTGSDNRGNSIFVDASRNIYTTGYFTDTLDLNPDTGRSVQPPLGSADIFIQKMSQCIKSSSAFSVSACNSYKSPSGRYTWTSSNTYIDTILNAGGCDSIMTIQVSIKKSSSKSIMVTACKSYTSPSGKYKWTSTNVYMDTIPNYAGCDSILTIHVIIMTSINSNISVAACNSYTSPSGKYEWTVSNTYKDTISSKAGCDSIITIKLTIGSTPSSSMINVTACNKYKSPSGKYKWTSSNTYKDTIPNKAGCDSVITINLSINTLDVSVNKNGTTLSASLAGATYQWINCGLGKQPIDGKTGQSFTAAVSGSYAVIITQGSCSDTSDCIQVTTSGMGENIPGNSLTAFPNPATGIFTIGCDEPFLNAILTVTDMQGRAIMQFNGIEGKVFLLDISRQDKGIYFIDLIQDNRTMRLKLVKY